ncbi:MAG: hypothetical protein CFH18_00439 [Alphaproteobacteria bacterium MarineAlpha5_Bin8]|nr:MAG: hypothetical protein CFH17_00692 [Alphaproteobacteria bacterium MarineAlpha5_Bin7]PPR47274.1 MAG: hypothetical protein CFH18_00439 [Alphaproteobacteria bacterium MarineAlpha5_Bin8]PPR54588.1 MAG: hypothetical protein CFH16_00284 [Alphaproteobacteria bacterium MarineAlpha5_Bin6]
MLNKFFIFLFFIFFSSSLNAHTFTGMVGFYDGISHPVLGIDHFLAMVSVGIVSAQIGGRAIWTVPSTFVFIMIIGGILGITAELNKGLDEQVISLSEIESVNFLADYIYMLIEIGIILSVILLGLAIAIDKKLPVNLIMIFVGIFGFCHGTAHGLEMPWASNPILFALGFASGTATLHLFGVGIGHFALKTSISSILLRIVGIFFAVYGFYLIFQF